MILSGEIHLHVPHFFQLLQNLFFCWRCVRIFFFDWFWRLLLSLQLHLDLAIFSSEGLSYHLGQLLFNVVLNLLLYALDVNLSLSNLHLIWWEDALLHKLWESRTVHVWRNCAQFCWVSILKEPLCSDFVLLATIKCLKVVDNWELIAPLPILAIINIWLFYFILIHALSDFFYDVIKAFYVYGIIIIIVVRVYWFVEGVWFLLFIFLVVIEESIDC